jgi:ABC-type Fe2+-enterobactin transport system substrate-binding protein
MFPVVLGGLLPLVGAGCQEGPAEQAGEKVDQAAREVRDTVDPPSGPAEAVGRKLDDATDKVAP